MFFFLISCFSFILVSKSFCLWKHPRMAKRQWRLVSPWLWEALSSFTVSWLQKGRVGIGLLNQIPKMKMMVLGWVWHHHHHHHHGSKEEKDRMISLLDLPELTLECILERLSPSGLCSVAGVCSSFRERCTSDHLWEKHMKQKWSKVIGEAAYREWQGYVHLASASSARKRPSQSASLSGPRKQNKNWFLGFLTNKINYKWSFSWFRPNIENSSFSLRTDLPVDSIMSCYLSLETGKFWFPAQVYNRENGHAGFMLSCYDAKLSYDSKTDTFQARYGRRTSEDNISWDRIRVPPIDTSSDVLHISDCLHDLKPGDHIEIQWRRNEEFPYGWWYGVVGHLESCDPNQTHCQCQHSESVMLEFKQYGDNSRWRRTMINRKEHREIGNEADGFYGGIRKLYKEEEISMWKRVWPNQILQ